MALGQDRALSQGCSHRGVALQHEADVAAGEMREEQAAGDRLRVGRLVRVCGVAGREPADGRRWDRAAGVVAADRRDDGLRCMRQALISRRSIT
jgi:hypothetical protein